MTGGTRTKATAKRKKKEILSKLYNLVWEVFNQKESGNRKLQRRILPANQRPVEKSVWYINKYKKHHACVCDTNFLDVKHKTEYWLFTCSWFGVKRGVVGSCRAAAQDQIQTLISAFGPGCRLDINPAHAPNRAKLPSDASQSSRQQELLINVHPDRRAWKLATGWFLLRHRCCTNGRRTH